MFSNKKKNVNVFVFASKRANSSHVENAIEVGSHVGLEKKKRKRRSQQPPIVSENNKFLIDGRPTDVHTSIMHFLGPTLARLERDDLKSHLRPSHCFDSYAEIREFQERRSKNAHLKITDAPYLKGGFHYTRSFL